MDMKQSRLTILSAGSHQVDDVLVFADHLHHLHLRDQVGQILLCGVRCKEMTRLSGMNSRHVMVYGPTAGPGPGLTFQHLHSHFGDSGWLVLVQTHGLC